MSIDLTTQSQTLWEQNQSQFGGAGTDLSYGHLGGYTCPTCHCYVSPCQPHNCVFYQFPVTIVPWVSPFPVPVPVVQVVAKSPTEDVREALKSLEAAVDRLVAERSIRKDVEDALRRVAKKLADVPE